MKTTTIFVAPSYLPVGKTSTASRITTTRTYKPNSYGTFVQYFTLNNIGNNSWVAPSRRPTTSRIITTTAKYAYQKPKIAFAQ